MMMMMTMTMRRAMMIKMMTMMMTMMTRAGEKCAESVCHCHSPALAAAKCGFYQPTIVINIITNIIITNIIKTIIIACLVLRRNES